MSQSLYNSKLGSSKTKKNFWYSLFLMGIGAVIGGATSIPIFLFITGGTAAPSRPISAPPLSVEAAADPALAAAATPDGQATQNQAAVTETDALPNPVNVVVSDTNELTTEETPPTVVEEEATAAIAPSPQLFRIVSRQSEARFSVYETFPEGTAVGRTDQIAGDILVDFETPANSQLGTIRVNLRTLRTDDADRDRSIRCCVLLTAQPEFEFSDFVPTSIMGLPEQIEVGQTIDFQVTGDFTLRGVTRPVTFNVSVSVISKDELRGLATTVVNRSSFGILNNDENGFDYHGVEETITLEFDFVARAVEE